MLGLKRLDLSGNGLTYASLESLADILIRKSTLEWLALAKNPLESLEGLWPALCGLKQLGYLDLSHTGLRANAVGRLAEASPGLVSLAELRLSGNHIGEAGMARLIQNLHRLSALRRLDCSDNDVPEESMQVVLGAFGAAMRLGGIQLEAVEVGQRSTSRGGSPKRALLV